MKAFTLLTIKQIATHFFKVLPGNYNMGFYKMGMKIIIP